MLSVKLINDPILRKVCAPVDVLDMIFVQDLLDEMFTTMKAENGIGLAANQVGFPVRIFILKADDGYKEYINPEIVAFSDLVDFEGEGCLSIPGVSSTTKRYKNVSLTWYDRNGIRNEGVFDNMQAFAIQHEMDHLNGKLYVDQFGPMKRELLLGKHRKFIRNR